MKNTLLFTEHQNSGHSPGADSDYCNVRTCQPWKILLVNKSGKRCQKSGKYWIKSGNREISRMFIFFPVSARIYLTLLNFVKKKKKSNFSVVDALKISYTGFLKFWLLKNLLLHINKTFLWSFNVIYICQQYFDLLIVGLR